MATSATIPQSSPSTFASYKGVAALQVRLTLETIAKISFRMNGKVLCTFVIHFVRSSVPLHGNMYEWPRRKRLVARLLTCLKHIIASVSRLNMVYTVLNSVQV